MQKLLGKLILGVVVISMVACATVKDVQRGTDIIRTDNELARMLDQKQLDPNLSWSAEMTQIGDHAKEEGDALKETPGKAFDALAYYRIAATAYWKSSNPDVTNHLFAAVNSGIETCNAMGANAPDRDCLFLQLIIPFAGLESFANEKQISILLDNVVFSDGTAMAVEIETMNEVADFLQQVKPQVESILAIGKDERLLSHHGMNAYYCDNARKVMDFFDTRAARYTTKVSQFEESFPSHDPPLDMSLEQAQSLRKLENILPELCSP
jgi:hypothetical protein